MAVMENYHLERLATAVSAPRQVSLLRKVANIAGCLLCLPLYWVATVHCRWPVTLDLVITILLTELTRYTNEGRRMAYYQGESLSPVVMEKADPEKAALGLDVLSSSTPRMDCIAAVVGWREDPALFTRALQSYKTAKGVAFLLVGIDGDEVQDQDMVDVFDAVSCLF